MGWIKSLAVLALLAGLQACTLTKAVVHNFADLDDHRIFANREVAGPAGPADPSALRNLPQEPWFLAELAVPDERGASFKLDDYLARTREVVVAQELLSKYKWDTSDLYGPQRGNSTEDLFARIFRAGIGYSLPQNYGIVNAEVEMIGGDSYLGRIGIEVPVVEQITLRGGVERLDFSDLGIEAFPRAEHEFLFVAEIVLVDFAQRMCGEFVAIKNGIGSHMQGSLESDS